MEVICKKEITDTAGNILFYKNKSYKVERVSASKHVLVKDELGGLRPLPSDNKFFKEHFEVRE